MHTSSASIFLFASRLLALHDERREAQHHGQRQLGNFDDAQWLDGGSG